MYLYNCILICAWYAVQFCLSALVQTDQDTNINSVLPSLHTTKMGLSIRVPLHWKILFGGSTWGLRQASLLPCANWDPLLGHTQLPSQFGDKGVMWNLAIQGPVQQSSHATMRRLMDQGAGLLAQRLSDDSQGWGSPSHLSLNTPIWSHHGARSFRVACPLSRDSGVVLGSHLFWCLQSPPYAAEATEPFPVADFSLFSSPSSNPKLVSVLLRR